MQSSFFYSGKITKEINKFNEITTSVQPKNGEQLAATELNTFAINIRYTPSQKFLEAAWQHPVSSSDYRQHIRFIGLCIAILKIEYILVDFTKFGVPSDEDQQNTAAFLLKVLQNTTLKRSARVLSGDVSQFELHTTILENGPKLPYKVEVFCDTLAARKWLFDEPVTQDSSQESMLIPFNSSLKALKNLSHYEAEKVIKTVAGTRESVKEVTILKTDFVTITSDQKESVLNLQWLKNITSREFRFGVLKAARALQENHVKYLLMNNQRMGILTLEDQTWFVSNSIHVISKSKLEKMAVINSSDVLQQLTCEAMEAKIRQANLTFGCKSFLSEREAIGWLLNPSNKEQEYHAS